MVRPAMFLPPGPMRHLARSCSRRRVPVQRPSATQGTPRSTQPAV